MLVESEWFVILDLDPSHYCDCVLLDDHCCCTGGGDSGRVYGVNDGGIGGWGA